MIPFKLPPLTPVPQWLESLLDIVIPLYVRFQWGFGYISQILSIVGFIAMITAALLISGIRVPIEYMIILGAAILGFCAALGTVCEKLDIQNRISSHINMKANPEFSNMIKTIQKMNDDMNTIKAKLGIESIERDR